MCGVPCGPLTRAGGSSTGCALWHGLPCGPHVSAASGRGPTIAPKGSDWVVQGKGPVRHMRDTARMRPRLRGGRVSAEGPQRRCRCAQKAHMARRKELANKVNRPPRDARAGGVRQPRGEVRRVHGPHGRAQDDMASGRALVRGKAQHSNLQTESPQALRTTSR